MQQKEDVICVIGDSYAGHRRNTDDPANYYVNKLWSWVNLVENHYGTKLDGKSFPGQSFWHQRRWFLEYLSNNKNHANTVLIFCHTSAMRLPANKDFPLSLLTLSGRNKRGENLLNATDKKLADLAKEFYVSDLFVNDFYAFALYSWLAELPALTKNYKKVIHFFGFDEGFGSESWNIAHFDLSQLMTKNSVVVTNPLLALSQSELGEKYSLNLDRSRANHFNQHNNYCMFEEIKNIIDNVPGGNAYNMNISKWDLRDYDMPTMAINYSRA